MPPTSFPADDFIQSELDRRLRKTGEVFGGGAAMSMHGEIVFGTDALIRTAVEHLEKKSHNGTLTFLLTTGGGFIEVTQRIVETIRHHFKHVNVVIPDVAYSAGTVLAMSGDAIYMDYYSRLGPIDPQVDNAKGNTVPALGYLQRYEQLLEKATNGTITLPEMQLMIDGFDQAELYRYEQARELSVSLLRNWLATYKFKNWEKTETTGKKVTVAMREQRAEEIARKLNDVEEWHSHGHGISPEVLRDKLNLKIDDYGANPAQKEAISSYHELANDYLLKTGIWAVHAPELFLSYQHVHA